MLDRMANHNSPIFIDDDEAPVLTRHDAYSTQQLKDAIIDPDEKTADGVYEQSHDIEDMTRSLPSLPFIDNPLPVIQAMRPLMTLVEPDKVDKPITQAQRDENYRKRKEMTLSNLHTLITIHTNCINALHVMIRCEQSTPTSVLNDTNALLKSTQDMCNQQYFNASTPSKTKRRRKTPDT